MRNIDTAIIIVNWNGKRFLKDCLDSLFNQTYKKFKVILVDNDSKDGSQKFVEKNYPKVQLIKLDYNFGFSRGNNIGIMEAFKDESIKYIVCLNNDTKVDKNWLKELIKIVDLNPRIGICQSKILYYNNPKIINSVGILTSKDMTTVNRGIGEPDHGQYEEIEEIFGDCAASVLYTRKMLEDINVNNEFCH